MLGLKVFSLSDTGPDGRIVYRLWVDHGLASWTSKAYPWGQEVGEDKSLGAVARKKGY